MLLFPGKKPLNIIQMFCFVFLGDAIMLGPESRRSAAISNDPGSALVRLTNPPNGLNKENIYFILSEKIIEYSGSRLK